jgi:membrane-associated protease RseP (regulator of RpoE activity)
MRKMAAVGTSLSTIKAWPELYGFWIYGDGPAYVIHVELSSIAEAAGIRVGDRLIELDNKDVSRMSAEAIKLRALKSRNIPPPISVQSFCQVAELVSIDNFPGASKTNGFGLTVRGDSPVVADYVVDSSPAYIAGIRAGDFIVEANQKQMQFSEEMNRILNESSMVKLKFIPKSREGVDLFNQKQSM